MSRVTVGMIGLGVVGSGVVRLLEKQKRIVLKRLLFATLRKNATLFQPAPLLRTSPRSWTIPKSK